MGTYTASQAWRGIADYVKIDTVEVGGLGTDVEIKFDVETYDIIFGQTRTPVSTGEKTKKFQVTFAFGEYTWDNLAVALGQAAANLTDDTYLLITSAAADEVDLEIKVKNEAEAFYYTFFFPKCKIAESGAVPFSFEEQSYMSVTFDCFVHTGSNIGYATKVAV